MRMAGSLTTSSAENAIAIVSRASGPSSLHVPSTIPKGGNRKNDSLLQLFHSAAAVFFIAAGLGPKEISAGFRRDMHGKMNLPSCGKEFFLRPVSRFFFAR